MQEDRVRIESWRGSLSDSKNTPNDRGHLNFGFSLIFLLVMLYLVFVNFLVVYFKYNHQYISYFIVGILTMFIFLFPFLRFLVYLRIKKSDIIDILLLGIISTIGLLTGLKNGASLFSALISLKDYTLFYLFLLFSRYRPVIKFFKNIKLTFIYFAMISIFLLNFSYTVWMYLNFRGDLNILWFHEYYQNLYFNYIRNGHLRATGFFDTPIQNSIFFGFTTVFFLYSLIYGPKKVLYSIFMFFLTFLSISGLYMTHTRIGFVIILIALIMIFMRKFRNSSILPFIITLSIVFFSFFYIILFSKEPSAVGRIFQYENLFNKLMGNKSLLYSGYGFGNVGPKTKNIAADSAIIESIYTFGLFWAMVYILLFIRLFKKIWKYLSRIQSGKLFFEFSNVFFLSLLYISFFHSLVGKVVVGIFAVFVSIALSKTYNYGYKKENIKQNARIHLNDKLSL